MTRRSDGEKTRQLILETAADVFAARGFHDARVADICRQAGVNGASANYYFGSKKELYREAWRYAFDLSVATHPPDDGVPATAPADERLHGRIRALVHRIMDPASLDFDIVLKEWVAPTGLLSEIMHRSIEPLRDALYGVVRELIGPNATDDDTTMCVMSVQGQCFGLLMPRRSRARHRQGTGASCDPMHGRDAERVAEHIFRFSLAGIHAVRDRSRTVNEPISAGKRGS